MASDRGTSNELPTCQLEQLTSYDSQAMHISDSQVEHRENPNQCPVRPSHHSFYGLPCTCTTWYLGCRCTVVLPYGYVCARVTVPGWYRYCTQLVDVSSKLFFPTATSHSVGYPVNDGYYSEVTTAKYISISGTPFESTTNSHTTRYVYEYHKPLTQCASTLSNSVAAIISNDIHW